MTRVSSGSFAFAYCSPVYFPPFVSACYNEAPVGGVLEFYGVQAHQRYICLTAFFLPFSIRFTNGLRMFLVRYPWKRIRILAFRLFLE